MRRNVQVVVICEDRQQEVCARRFLKECGFHPRKTEFVTCPKGKQSGEQFVRENYPSEVRAYRSRRKYLSVCLAVIIDADTKTVAQRLQEFDASLVNDSQEKRQPDEKIAIFVPKRNIETWIYHLRGETVDEETAYPKLQRERECKSYMKILAARCAGKQTDNPPPSLRKAEKELQRIK